MNPANLAQYRQALLGATAQSAPTPSVAPTPALQGNFNNIATMYSGQSQAGAAARAINAVGGAASAQANDEEAQRKAALQQAQEEADALEQKKKDLTDPSKYRQEINQEGGFDFFDPEGNKIDVKQYSGVTGKHITEILKKSQNPYDREFVRNYENVEKIGQIFQSGDKKAKEKLFKQNPDIEEDYKLLKKTLKREPTYNDIVRSFRSGYSDFFNTDTKVKNSNTSYGNEVMPGVDTRSLKQRALDAINPLR